MRTLVAVAIALAALAGGCGSTVTARRAGSSVTAARPRPLPVHVSPYRKPVPVLMYHEVRVPPPGAPNPGLFVSEKTFAGQARWLEQSGYRGVSMERLRKAWAGRARMPRRPVVLTFDDGYDSVYRNVVPVLKRLHWPGVLYLELGATRSPDGVSRAQVTRMMHDGWELGSHTISHLDLTTLGPAQLREETAGARDLIRRWFHRTPKDFCYPAGRYNRTVIKALRRAGYLTATTTQPGLGTPDKPFEIKRIRVEESGGVNGLATTIRSLHG